MSKRIDQLVEALRRKHGTAENALRALGFDAALVNDIMTEAKMTKPHSFTRARDEEEEEENNEKKVDAGTAQKWLRYLAGCGLPDEELAGIREVLAKYSDGELSEDEEENPDGNPPPGGLELRLQREREETKAMDAAMRRRLRHERDQRALALDSRAAQSFADRFPEAALIRRV